MVLVEGQIHRSTEQNPYKYTQPRFNKVAKAIRCRIENLFNKWYGATEHPKAKTLTQVSYPI